MSECTEWHGWMWKRLIVARVFMCVLHQLSVILSGLDVSRMAEC